jgi:hypothetical protein
MSKAKENALQKLARINTEAAKITLQSNAKQIFETLENSNRYDELTASLELLEKFVFRVHEEAIDGLEKFLERLKTLEIEYSEEYHMRYATNLVVKTLDVLFNLRFMDVERVSDIICSYLSDGNNDVSKRSEELLKQLASYDLRAINKIGYYPQTVLLGKISSWNDNALIKLRQPITVACREFLQATAEGTSSDYKTITWHTATLTIHEDLKEIRDNTIALLKRLYGVQNDVSERIRVMDTLRGAVTLPHQTPYNDDWIELVKENFEQIAEFYLLIYDDCGFLEYQEMEHQLYWFPKRGIKFEDSEKAIAELKEKLSANEEYQIFKIIMGDDRSYSSYWEEGDWSFKKSRNFRKEKIDEYIPQIGDDFEVWQKRILSYMDCFDDTSSGVYEFMPYFLKRLAQEYPEKAIELLNVNAEKFSRYLCHFLIGLLESKTPERLYTVSEEWLDKGLYLETLIRCHDLYGDREEEFIERTINRAQEVEDQNTLGFALSIIAKNHESNPQFYAQKFLECIRALREVGHNWSKSVWFRPQASKLIASLPEEEVDYLLNTLLDQGRLDYREEDMLLPIAKTHPAKVIELFAKRIEKQQKERGEGGLDSRYDAIPYEFYSLSEPLAENAKTVMPLIYKWFDSEDWLYRWDGARLLSNVFVHFEEVFEAFLIDKVKHGTKDDSVNVLRILREYNGSSRVLNTCIEIAKLHGDDEDIKSELVCALDATGVVSGEYGFRDAYKGKLSFVEEMMQMDNEKVKAFAKDYKDHLEKCIEYETKRADKDIAVRKKVWGVKDDD